MRHRLLQAEDAALDCLDHLQSFQHTAGQLRARLQVGIADLPDELLTIIFDDLNANDLLSCWSTSKRWKSILSDVVPHLTLHLRGDVEDIDEQWKHYRHQIESANIRSLVVEYREDKIRRRARRRYAIPHRGDGKSVVNSNAALSVAKRWKRSSIANTFPHETLESIRYFSDFQGLDKPFWKCLTQCVGLKSLKWVIRTKAGQSDPAFRPKFTVKGTPLEKCQPELIEIKTGYCFDLEPAFEKLLDNLKYRFIDTREMDAMLTGITGSGTGWNRTENLWQGKEDLGDDNRWNIQGWRAYTRPQEVSLQDAGSEDPEAFDEEGDFEEIVESSA
ncbi:hypothetical protein CBS101457_002598 [Exobasidium rhododendri]|nr:hypothetical protein CBS101457_002598 [Exobasidium rhododendri]